MNKGYIQVYTGDGKGKTTAALGLGMRAAGRGLNVLMIQFLKGVPTGELESARQLTGFTIVRFGETKKFIYHMDENEKKQLQEKINHELNGFDEFLREHPCDLLILDEILGAIHAGLVLEDWVLEMLHSKPLELEIVLTGRNVTKKIAEKADLITEMISVKHYMNEGVPARVGIEM